MDQIVNDCRTRLARCHQHMEAIGQREVAQDIARTLDNLYSVSQRHAELLDQHRARIVSLQDEVASQRTTIASERTAKTEAETLARRYRTERTALQATQARHTATINELQERITTKNASIERLNRAREREQRDARTAYERGFSAGQMAGRNEAQRQPPPSPAPTDPGNIPPTVNIQRRQSRLNKLVLMPTDGSSPSAALKQALIFGNLEILRIVLRQEPQVPGTALHMAALFGDVESAKLLISLGTPINGTCDAKSERPGALVHGVTPMHLAIGAQHEGMIRYLRSVGGSFLRPQIRADQRATAPPLWLVKSRWLDMVGDDVAKVVGVLRLLKQLGWDKNAVLNHDGENMRKIVRKEMGGRLELRSAILAQL